MSASSVKIYLNTEKQNRSILRHFLVKLQNARDKEKILKASKERGEGRKQFSYKESGIRTVLDFLVATMKTRQQRINSLRILRENNF